MSDFSQFYQATFNLQKMVNAALKAAQLAVRDINDELISIHNKNVLTSLTVNKNDYDISVTLFGIDILLKAEIPLPADQIEIVTYLVNPKDDKLTIKLESTLSLNVMGNQVVAKIGNIEYDISEATNILLKSLIEELKQRGTRVANK